MRWKGSVGMTEKSEDGGPDSRRRGELQAAPQLQAGRSNRRYTGRKKLPAFPTQTVGTQNPRKAAATDARPAVSRRCRDRCRNDP